MIVCPNCRHQEFTGALFCSECGAQFVQPRSSGSTTAIYTSIPDTALQLETPAFPTPPDDCNGANVAIKVIDSDEVVFLHSSEDFSLGRATAGQPIVPDIDLSPYNAYETGGVS